MKMQFGVFPPNRLNTLGFLSGKLRFRFYKEAQRTQRRSFLRPTARPLRRDELRRSGQRDALTYRKGKRHPAAASFIEPLQRLFRRTPASRHLSTEARPTGPSVGAKKKSYPAAPNPSTST